MSGVTLTLTGKTAANTAASLSVSSDTTTIESNISAFVSAYNTLAASFSSLGGFDSATDTAGPMMGNALLSGIENQVKSALYSVVNNGSSSYNSLASVGITTNSDGTLSLNNATLSNALATNFSAVSQLFSGSGGIATALNTLITQKPEQHRIDLQPRSVAGESGERPDRPDDAAQCPDGCPDGKPHSAVFGA